MAPLRLLTVLLMLAALAANGLVRTSVGEPVFVSGIRPQVTVLLEKPSCCGTNAACCCVTAAAVSKQVIDDTSAVESACCGHADSRQEPFNAQNDEQFHPEMGTGYSAESPLCQCTAEQQVPLEESLPVGLPGPQANGDLCYVTSAENRLASDDLTVVNRSGSVQIAAAPLPLPVLLQLATLCCWRA